jgi:phosphatidate cytidylyltransferase
MAAASQTIAAMPAGDVTFADNEIAFGKTFHEIADAFDDADELVPDGHRDGDGLLGPGIPVIYMYVRPADRGFQDPDEHVIPLHVGHRRFLEPESRLGLRLHHSLHRFLHGPKLTAARKMSILRVIESFEMMDEMPATLEQPASETVKPRSVFILRFISTVVLWSVALAIAFSGYEVLFWLLISAFGLVALLEFYRMLDHANLPNFKITGLICGGIMLAGSFYYFSKVGPAQSYDFELSVLLFFLLTVFTRQMFARLKHDEPLRTMAYTLFGLLYVLWLFNFITKILYLTPRAADGTVTGQFYVLYLIAVTKFSDMGAYLTGSAIGRHLMSPHISAKKTWEGFFGALVFALLCSLALFKLMPGHLSMLTWTHATVLGLLLGFAAIIGDLGESIIKRSTGVKDSGGLLPGIGGALDLIDSLLFTAPLLFFYLRLVIRVS